MVRERYVREGPSKGRYGLSAEKNRDVDSRKKSLAYSQAGTSKRDQLDSKVKSEGGRVHWIEEAEKERVFPYTRAEHETLKGREKIVAGKMRELKEKYGVRGIENLTNEYDIDDFLTGKSKFNVHYTADGKLEVQKLKEGTSGRVYSISEANGVLRNLERYAEHIEKTETFKRRHGNKSQLEVSSSAAAAVLGIGLGAFFITGTITGNVISENVLPGASIFGGLFMILGILGAFAFLKKGN